MIKALRFLAIFWYIGSYSVIYLLGKVGAKFRQRFKDLNETSPRLGGRHSFLRESFSGNCEETNKDCTAGLSLVMWMKGVTNEEQKTAVSTVTGNYIVTIVTILIFQSRSRLNSRRLKKLS